MERRQKQVTLDEFRANPGYHRKYAIRLLNGPVPERVRRPVRRRRVPTYSPATIAVLARLWEAAGYPWSVRLKALVSLWSPWILDDLDIPQSALETLTTPSRRRRSSAGYT